MTSINDAQTPEQFYELWESSHISDKPASNVRHKDVLIYLSELEKVGIKNQIVGKSFGGRSIHQVEWGEGDLKVFMWSQMHGDEPTATSALFDMLAFLQSHREKLDWVEVLHKSLTIRAIPMLNPDGAETFQRRNLQSIDINRDARRLQTPEGRLLKKLRDEWNPDIGFNLHNQQELTTVGRTFKQATNSFLAVSGRKDGGLYEGHERNRRLCAVMIKALNKFVDGYIGRYDDSYNPRAFGDMISAWGTPVILIETGGHHGKGEDFLVRLNFVAFLSALQALVDGSERDADPLVYENLPFNSSGKLFNYMFRKANVVNFGDNPDPFVADIAIVRERRREDTLAPTFVREIGDLGIYKGLEEYDASGYYVVSQEGRLRIGRRGHLLFYKKDRDLDWTHPNFLRRTKPDGEFLNGKWLKELPAVSSEQ